MAEPDATDRTDDDDELELLPQEEKAAPPPPPEPEETPLAPEPEETPLTLEPEEEPAEREAPPRTAPAEERKAPAKEPEEPRALPTLKPLDWFGIVAWPLAEPAGPALLTTAFVWVFFLFMGWLIGLIPFVGDWLRALVDLAVTVYVLAHCRRIIYSVLAGIAEAPLPPGAREEPGTFRKGILAALLAGFYGLPALVIGLVAGSPWAALPFLLIFWAIFPAALLLYSATDRWLVAANPSVAAKTALAAQPAYLFCLLPTLPFLLARLLFDESLPGISLEFFALFTLVYTSLLLGLLARENEAVAGILISEMPEEEEEEEKEEKETEGESSEGAEAPS